MASTASSARPTRACPRTDSASSAAAAAAVSSAVCWMRIHGSRLSVTREARFSLLTIGMEGDESAAADSSAPAAACASRNRPSASTLSSPSYFFFSYLSGGFVSSGNTKRLGKVSTPRVAQVAVVLLCLPIPKVIRPRRRTESDLSIVGVSDFSVIANKKW